MINVRIDLRERPDGSVVGAIYVYGQAVSEELVPVQALDGSTWKSSGGSTGGSFLDVLDVMASRVVYKLEQGILF